MARYRGRVIVKKVDSKGRYISGSFSRWRLKHPNEQFFDSKTEWSVWNYAKNHLKNIELISQKSLVLFEASRTTEFIDGKIKNVALRKIGFTPDYYIKKWDVYIEVKGYADPLFKLRWKLFKFLGYTGYVVYSLDEFKQLINELENAYS